MNFARRLLSLFGRLDIRNSTGAVYMRRYHLLRMPWFKVYVHEILLSDEYYCEHDHPWGFVSIVLWGGYYEHMGRGRFWRAPGSVLIRPAETAHRVEVSKPAWSMVFVGRKRRAWGFFTKNGWRPYTVDIDRPICVDVL